MPDPNPKFLIVDGMSLVFRGFYAIPKLTTYDGKNTNAVLGFYMVLFNLIKQVKPTHIAICFDLKGKTKRKEQYEDYKANRQKAPDELYEQIPYIKQGINQLRFNLIEKEGYEADDLIATISIANAKQGIQSIVYTNDLDILQLTTYPEIKILTPHNQKTGKLMDKPAVIEKYGFTPQQIPDYKGLHGDPSDNLPGVRGIGPKTAKQLLSDYQTLEGIYDNLDALSAKMQEKFREHREISFLCKELATLETDLDYQKPETDFQLKAIDLASGLEFLETFHLKSQIRHLNDIAKLLDLDGDPVKQKAPAPEATPEPNQSTSNDQLALF